MSKDNLELSQSGDLTVRPAITVDQLVSSTATAVLRALQDFDRNQFVNPKIWCGVEIDLQRFGRIGQPGAGGPG